MLPALATDGRRVKEVQVDNFLVRLRRRPVTNGHPKRKMSPFLVPLEVLSCPVPAR